MLGLQEEDHGESFLYNMILKQVQVSGVAF